jgi:Matrixin
MKKISAIALAILSAFSGGPSFGYAFNEVVPDVRQAAALSGGSACPVRSHQFTAPASIALRWSTVLSTSPLTVLTQNQTAPGRLTEIEQVISQSLAVWTGVSGTSLRPASFAPVSRITTASGCGSDGINSICFDQPDAAFTPGVLAFTRVITADAVGEQIGTGTPSTQVGQILDADIYFNPSDSQAAFATPAALPTFPRAYDLESVLTHELGHTLGFSHSAVWNAMMYPYAPAPGTFIGPRPTTQQPDAPLAEDDRTGLRVLYPDPADTLHGGSIGGRVLPANPLSLPAPPAGVTGIFGAHVVAVDAATGAVIAGTLGGWSCVIPGPAHFDGGYQIERLPVGHSYIVYAEPLDGTVAPAQVSNALAPICRNPASDPGWPPLQGCVVPAVNAGFTVRSR